MVENAPKHLPYQSSPEYKWKEEEEEEEARRDLHTAKEKASCDSTEGRSRKL